MKKILFLTFIFTFLTAFSFSQNIGIFVGGGFSDMRFRTDSADLDKEINKEELNFRKIYHAGINFENDLIEKQLYLQLGLHVRLSGYSAHDDSVGMYLHNIHVPLELKYKYFFNKRGDSYVYASGGPYFAMAFKGIKYDEDNKQTFLEDEEGWYEMINPRVNLGKSMDDDIEAFDYGMNIGIGFGYSHLQIGYNFGLGLSNVIPKEWIEPGEKFKWMHGYHSFTLGFYFTNN